MSPKSAEFPVVENVTYSIVTLATSLPALQDIILDELVPPCRLAESASPKLIASESLE